MDGTANNLPLRMCLDNTALASAREHVEMNALCFFPESSPILAEAPRYSTVLSAAEKLMR
jgi:hypothetical protein